MIGQPSQVPGYDVPLHRSLTEPVLIAGAPRNFVIPNGTLAAAVGLGLRLWIAGLLIWPRLGRVRHAQGPGFSARSVPPRPPQRSSVMLNLAEYKRTATCLSDYLPWACLVAPGTWLCLDRSR